MSESEWETDTDPPTDDESVNNTSAATAGQDTPGIKTVALNAKMQTIL